MPEASIGRGGAGSARSQRIVSRRAKRVKPYVAPRPVVKAPAGDVASSGGDYGMKQASRAARSPKVKRDTRAVYDAQSVARRGKIVRNVEQGARRRLAASGRTTAPATQAEASILPIHASRIARNRELQRSAATKDTKGASDRARANAFLKAHPEILKPHKDDKKKGSLLATMTGASKLGLKAASLIPGAQVPATLNALTKGGVTKLGVNALKDIADITTGTVPSTIKLTTTALKTKKGPGPIPLIVPNKPGKALKMLADPYVKFYHHPGKFAFEHPASTTLMFLPTARVPGRVAGRVARVVGKQTLERPAAALEGTAIRANRTGSRDAIVRAWQSKRDKAAAKRSGGATPTVKDSEIHKQVDEFYDLRRHEANRAEARAYHEGMKATKGHAPRKERRAAAREHAHLAREQVHAETDAAFVKHFGANVRPAVGHAERAAAQAKRDAANAQIDVAKKRVASVKAEHDQALANARVANARTARNPKLRQLEREHGAAKRDVARRKRAADDEYQAAVAAAERAQARGPKTPKLVRLEREHAKALKELKAAQGTHADAMAALGKARGRAEVLSRNVGGDIAERRAGARTVTGETPQYAAGGHGVKAAADELQVHHGNVGEARARVRDVEDQLAAERDRISGVPPAQADALHRAIARREDVHQPQIAEARRTAKDIKKQIKAERRRIKGVPPAEHDALIRSLHEQETAATTLQGAKYQHTVARAEHIQAKSAMSQAPLTSPKPEGRIFKELPDAGKVARELPYETTIIRLGEKGKGGYGLVPKVAAERLGKHKVVGTAKAPGAKLLRTTSRLFRRAVLPLSGKWLAGQGIEAGVRSAAMGAGPMSLWRTHRTVKAMNAKVPGSGDAFLNRAIPGGQFDPGAVLRHGEEFNQTLADEYAGTALHKPAKAATWAGKLPPVKLLRHGYGTYARFVMDTVNGLIETTAQKAMLGKAIKKSPIMERKILGLSDKAIQEAADGLTDTATQAELGRAVIRAYGQYSRLPPGTRETMAHTTPFWPWYRNMTNFLFRVLPADHPVKTAILADIDATEEEWRKANRISFHSKKLVPPFLIGTYPLGGGKYLNAARYTPSMPGSPVEALGSLFVPQLMGPILAMAPGVTWKGQEIKSGDPRLLDLTRTREAGTTALESLVPGAAQVGRATGWSDKYLRGNPVTAKKIQSRPPLQNLGRSLSPFTPIEANLDKKKKGTKKKSGGGGFGGGGFGGSGFGGGSGF